MKINSISDDGATGLQGKAILIIHGLSDSGRGLARVLSAKGANIAIVSSRPKPDLAYKIRQEVEENGCRCLILTPKLLRAEEKTFSQKAIRKIIEVFGHLDAFISYSADDQKEKSTLNREIDQIPKNLLFDQQGLTKAAMKQIVIQ